MNGPPVVFCLFLIGWIVYRLGTYAARHDLDEDLRQIEIEEQQRRRARAEWEARTYKHPSAWRDDDPA
jgi:hypothetical protein